VRPDNRRDHQRNLALLFSAGVPTDNGRLARHGVVKDGFRRSDPEASPTRAVKKRSSCMCGNPAMRRWRAWSWQETRRGQRVRIIVKGFIESPRRAVRE